VRNVVRPAFGAWRSGCLREKLGVLGGGARERCAEGCAEGCDELLAVWRLVGVEEPLQGEAVVDSDQEGGDDPRVGPRRGSVLSERLLHHFGDRLAVSPMYGDHGLAQLWVPAGLAGRVDVDGRDTVAFLK